jgi:hypothetical protein
MYCNRLHSCSVAGGFVSNFRHPSLAVAAASCGVGIPLLRDCQIDLSTIFSAFVNILYLCIYMYKVRNFFRLVLNLKHITSVEDTGKAGRFYL